MTIAWNTIYITHPNWFRSRGRGSYIFANVWKTGGVNPSLFAKNVWELVVATPQNEACMREMCSL
jgi:hypothetical protein